MKKISDTLIVTVKITVKTTLVGLAFGLLSKVINPCISYFRNRKVRSLPVFFRIASSSAEYA